MQAVLYSKENCQECDRVKNLFNTLKISHLEYQLGVHFNQKQFRAEFGEKAEFPQVAIGYKHIGGLKETLQYFKTQKLI